MYKEMTSLKKKIETPERENNKLVQENRNPKAKAHEDDKIRQ